LSAFFLAALGALFCGATSLAAGSIALNTLRVRFRRSEQALIGFLVGGAVLSLLSFC